jgi:phosphoribosylformimino-5-aminoimidazole carboxamide ribotide isomerase
VISRVIAQTGLSIEVGGGIRTRAAIERMLAAGARRVILGTILVSDPDFARTAVAEYGEALCAGVDARGGRVAVQGWLETSDVPAVELAAELASWGYRHIVYTDIARDGMRSGIDAKAYEGLSRAAGLAIIASGGIATLDDLLALKACGPHVEAAIVGRAIYEGSITIPAALEALMDAACADCQPSDPCASQGGERC